jgi:hypothetical protein
MHGAANSAATADLRQNAAGRREGWTWSFGHFGRLNPVRRGPWRISWGSTVAKRHRKAGRCWGILATERCDRLPATSGRRLIPTGVKPDPSVIPLAPGVCQMRKSFLVLFSKKEPAKASASF